MNETTTAGRLVAVRMLVTAAGKPVAWLLFDLGRGKGRKEVVDLSTNQRVESCCWTTRMAYLRAEKSLDDNRQDTGWVKA